MPKFADPKAPTTEECMAEFMELVKLSIDEQAKCVAPPAPHRPAPPRPAPRCPRRVHIQPSAETLSG